MSTHDPNSVRVNKKKLLFPPQLESVFRLNSPLIKSSWFFQILGGLSIVTVGIQVFNHQALSAITLFFLGALISIAVTAWLQNNKTYVELYYSFAIFICGLSLTHAASHFPETTLNFSLLTVLVISCFVFFRLRVKIAWITGFSLIATYGFVVFAVPGIPVYKAFAQTAFLLLIGVVGAGAGYILEYYSRTAFLKGMVLERLSKTIQQKDEKAARELLRANKSLELEILAHIEAESHLRESEEKYRSLVTSLPDGIMIARNDKIAYANPALERLCGYDTGALIGMRSESIFADLPPQESDGLVEIPDVLIRKDGVFLYIEKTVVSIDYRQERALLFSIRDVTEKILARQEKERLRQALGRARKMEALGLMAGGVAHDLNNILAGLVSIPDTMLADLPQDSSMIEPVKIIKESGKQATVMVDDLLMLTRGTRRKPEPVQFNYIVEDYLISPEFRLIANAHPDVSIETQLDPNVSYFEGYGIAIRKIVMNLVSNAVEAVGQNSGKVIIKTQWIQSKNENNPDGPLSTKNSLCFSVEDTGQGIKTKDIDRIFEPFYSKKILGRSGTGLGLSIVWSGVQEHGGHIEVDSLGGRTVFNLYFPIP